MQSNGSGTCATCWQTSQTCPHGPPFASNCFKLPPIASNCLKLPQMACNETGGPLVAGRWKHRPSTWLRLGLLLIPLQLAMESIRNRHQSLAAPGNPSETGTIIKWLICFLPVELLTRFWRQPHFHSRLIGASNQSRYKFPGVQITNSSSNFQFHFPVRKQERKQEKKTSDANYIHWPAQGFPNDPSSRILSARITRGLEFELVMAWSELFQTNSTQVFPLRSESMNRMNGNNKTALSHSPSTYLGTIFFGKLYWISLRNCSVVVDDEMPLGGSPVGGSIYSL